MGGFDPSLLPTRLLAHPPFFSFLKKKGKIFFSLSSARVLLHPILAVIVDSNRGLFFSVKRYDLSFFFAKI